MNNDMSGAIDNLTGLFNNIFGMISAGYAQGLLLSGGKGQIYATGNSSTNGLNTGSSEVMYAMGPGGETQNDTYTIPPQFQNQELGITPVYLELFVLPLPKLGLLNQVKGYVGAGLRRISSLFTRGGLQLQTSVLNVICKGYKAVGEVSVPISC